MDQFPDFKAKGFDIEKYNSKFVNSNYIIHARARQVFFHKHWGCLSVKCAFQGSEVYECNGGVHSVNESSFLILNEGTYYSSYIDSPKEVESFTVNFTPGFEYEVYQALTSQSNYLLDNHSYFKKDEKLHFTEKLFNYNTTLSPIIHRLKFLSENWNANQELILENYFLLYDQLFQNERETQKMISRVEAVRSATKKELFIRLNRAKDFIVSNYKRNLTLEEMANVSCLNQYYFLRQFKKMFNYTPHQYLQHKRIQEAAILLKSTNYLVTEICHEVGFSDLASFSKLFKKHFERSPIEFKKKGSGTAW